MVFDRDILKSVKGHTKFKPQSLEGILGYVDGLQKTILTLEELEGGLRHLIESGQIAETGRLRFYDPEGMPASREFSGLTAEDHERAYEAYCRWFDEQDEKSELDEDALTRQKITLRWRIEGNRFPTDADEEAAEALAERVDLALSRVAGAEINGFEMGPGIIDILIFGMETDEDIESIYNNVVPTFRTFRCPPGSCIIRHYADRGTDVISDTVE